MSEREYAKGGFIPARGDLPTVKVRLNDGRREYWEPELSRWVPIISTAEIRGYSGNGAGDE